MVAEQGADISGKERHEWEMRSGSISSSPRGALESSICECSFLWRSVVGLVGRQKAGL